MDAKVRHFSPAEAALRLGVSVKALRLYERYGLVRPLRTQAGWRVYGPDEIEKLHRVLALRSLGLPLSRIAELTKGGGGDLDRVLALQEAALSERGKWVEDALRLIRAARGRLRAGEALSIDDLTTLAKETAMSADETLKTIFKPLIEKHFTEGDKQAVERRSEPFDQATITAEWDALFADCRRIMAAGDPSSPEAMDLAARWTAQVKKFTGDDPGLFQKSGAMWQEALADPGSAPKLPATAEMFAFVGQAEAARKAGSA